MQWARCNFDCHPVHSSDQAVVDEFRRYLRDPTLTRIVLWSQAR